MRSRGKGGVGGKGAVGGAPAPGSSTGLEAELGFLAKLEALLQVNGGMDLVDADFAVWLDKHSPRKGSSHLSGVATSSLIIWCSIVTPKQYV